MILFCIVKANALEAAVQYTEFTKLGFESVCNPCAKVGAIITILGIAGRDELIFDVDHSVRSYRPPRLKNHMKKVMKSISRN